MSVGSPLQVETQRDCLKTRKYRVIRPFTFNNPKEDCLNTLRLLVEYMCQYLGYTAIEGQSMRRNNTLLFFNYHPIFQALIVQLGLVVNGFAIIDIWSHQGVYTSRSVGVFQGERS